MPFRHKLQSSRYELKYLIDEVRATGIRGFLAAHLEVDEYAEHSPTNSYPISSVYLDTSDLLLYGQTVQGLKNRFKLRMRFYDNNPHSPVFLEIKRRVTNVICKERAAVSREGARRFLAGRRPDESQLVGVNGNDSATGALQNFCNLRDRIAAEALIYVSYVREAYVSPNSNAVRVTFDRELAGSPFDRQAGFCRPAAGTKPDLGGVVLELKFTDRFPPWARDLVQAFDLQRTSVPKYIECIRAMGIRPGWQSHAPTRLTP